MLAVVAQELFMPHFGNPSRFGAAFSRSDPSGEEQQQDQAEEREEQWQQGGEGEV